MWPVPITGQTLAVGLFLLKVRALFFMKRPLTQVGLGLILGLLYFGIMTAFQRLGLVREALEIHLHACLTAAAVLPLACAVYDRVGSLRRRLHP